VVPTILREIAIANTTEGKDTFGSVIIISPRDKTEMDLEVAEVKPYG
jgi:hypothetical protein